MFPIATEFPIVGMTRATFVALITGWLKGTNYSKIFSEPIDSEIDSENAYLTSSIGEELRLREISSAQSINALGFRYDFPDNSGRTWRTEAVVKFSKASDDPNILRLRTQCLARLPEARVETPKKPYFLKSLIDDGYAGIDGLFSVSDRPHCLNDDGDDIDRAAMLISGQGSEHLPIVYFSAQNDGSFALDENDIGRLAFNLGGIAHIVQEPSRAFSFRLREPALHRNPYDGTIGVFCPQRGIVRKFYLGGAFDTQSKLFSAVEAFSLDLRSRLPASGWDWSELQESALRHQRERDKKRLSGADIEALYNEEIAVLRERITELEAISTKTNNALTHGNLTQSSEIEDIFSSSVPEIYDGEAIDRIFYFAKVVVGNSENLNIDDRSLAVAEQLLSWQKVSPALLDLRRNLDRAVKDPKKVSREMTALLNRHGYRTKSEKKHVRLEAEAMFKGLPTVTVPKSPSDARGLKNLKSQIEAALGISNL